MAPRDAFGFIDQVLGNIVWNSENFIEDHAAILQPVRFLIGANGSERPDAKSDGQKSREYFLHYDTPRQE